ncbi:MAG: BamA/TamA family outer membrane protein [Chlorobi bacterium]|nr:BamA/TamA family outer membrane protein [Chlorobiota bacterium]
MNQISYTLTYIKKTFLLSLVIFNLNILNAQQSNSYSILITGNTSKLSQNDKLLEKWQEISQNSNNIAFLMLGNIYNSKENKFSEELFHDNKYPLLLVPGEKEWANGSYLGKKTIEYIKDELQERYKGKVNMPDAACPGPKEVVLNKNIVVILIDSYWWVHKYDRRFTKCDIETTQDILIQIEDAIRRHYPSKHVIIAGHHTLKSFGNSSGYFSLKQYILQFPYTLYRKILGIRSDNHHPDFKEFRNDMLSVLQKYPDIIYVSAGDANLQYFNINKVNYVVSGSMVKTEFVRTSKPEYASSEKGFARLNFSNEGECEVVFTGVKGDIFRKTIYKKTFIDNVTKKNTRKHLPDSMTIKASSKYNIPKSAYFWVGENYRTIWNTPVKVPVFSLEKTKGGFQILKRGGGKQTHSLRLEDKNGKQYVLRSFEKYVEGFLPDELDSTFAKDLVQDQISAANPYAPPVVAKLAGYAGVFHTNPEVFYVADDPNLGIYRQDMANQLYIFEERPDGDRRDVASFGHSKNIISTEEMIKKIFKDEDHSIDNDAFLRARLFDILINDWDRHYDQWRWASFKDGEKTIYKPIPRDRDQAFFVNEGVITWISARKWLSPRFQNFDEYTENVNGLSFNARYLDRALLTQNDWKDWQIQIDSLKTLLTPDRIDKAVLSFPKEIQPLCADHTAEILKARLNNLESMTRSLYLSLAKEVNITGTNEEDMFEIDVLNDTTISITGFHLKNKNKKGAEIYKRVFYASETKKIRIYGFDKKDRFIINGIPTNKINLTIIGGHDDDRVIYESTKAPRFITIYDKKSTILSNNLKKRLINIYDDNELKYDWRAFKYDIVYPGLFLGYSQDDGIFLGGGPVINKYSRYRQQRYKVHANYAFLTEAFNIYFTGKNIYPLKRFELNVIVDIKSPNYVNNYFGMGNETEWIIDKSDKEYYRVRMKEYFVKTDFIKFLDKKKINKAGLGFFYKNTDVEATPNRFVSDFLQNDLQPDALLPHSFVGLSFNYKLNTIPNQNLKKEEEFWGSNMFRTRGMLLETEISYFKGLSNNSQDFARISGEWASYLSFSQRPRVVYALRLGGEKLIGDYVYYEAAKLGQKENLRGFRNTRFYGDASLYMNTEIRIRVKHFKTYILNGTAGMLLFNDAGRVWLEGENSSQWHDGYGVGLWWSLFDMALLTTSYAVSKEDSLINFSINYQF